VKAAERGRMRTAPAEAGAKSLWRSPIRTTYGVLQSELRRKRPRDALTSKQGHLRPSCARPLGGPRISSADWNRLVWLLAASAPARHLLGTCLALAWHLLGICFGGAPLPLLLWDVPPH
jgi:hypothetical protein